MDVTQSQQGAVTVLRIKGPMTAEGLGLFGTMVAECIAANLLKVVLDVEEVPFIDSAGLEKIQSVVSDLGKRGGDVRIASANEVCTDIFQATRMDSFFQTYEDRESAVRSLL